MICPVLRVKSINDLARAPDWWYLTLFVISVSLGLATVLGYSTQLPWWTYFVSIILALVFVIPCW